MRDFDGMKLDSYILKHYVEEHREEEMEKMEFRMRILKEARTAFERQIAESVQVQI